MRPLDAVIFDLDGLLLDSEQVWSAAKQRLVRERGGRWPAKAEHRMLGMASSSNREVIDLVLERTGWADLIDVSVASEEVPRGKPAPDVYLEAARCLGARPARCIAVEDSGPGIRSARAAGLGIIAIPNPHYPTGEAAMAEADVVLGSLAELDAATVESAQASRGERG